MIQNLFRRSRQPEREPRHYTVFGNMFGNTFGDRGQFAAGHPAIALLGRTFLLALACGLMLAVVTRAQTHRRQPAPAKNQPVKTPDEVVPFRSGEQLQYRVLWSKYSVNAGTVDFFVMEHREFFGRSAWHFRATAHTIDTMRILYGLDDQFDSYSEAIQLTSLQYEMYLHEAGKQQNDSWRLISDGSPAPKDAVAARVTPGTRDPIGFVYALRANDWKSAPEFRSPVFDGHHLYEVVSRLAQASGQVTVAAGQISAMRIDVRVSEHGQEMGDTRFSVWLSQDAARTPVLIEAQVPVGTARVELIRQP